MTTEEWLAREMGKFDGLTAEQCKTLKVLSLSLARVQSGRERPAEVAA